MRVQPNGVPGLFLSVRPGGRAAEFFGGGHGYFLTFRVLAVLAFFSSALRLRYSAYSRSQTRLVPKWFVASPAVCGVDLIAIALPFHLIPASRQFGRGLLFGHRPESSRAGFFPPAGRREGDVDFVVVGQDYGRLRRPQVKADVKGEEGKLMHVARSL